MNLDDEGEIEDRELEDEKHGRECGVKEHCCQDCQDVQRQRSEEKHLKLFQFNFKFSIFFICSISLSRLPRCGTAEIWTQMEGRQF